MKLYMQARAVDLVRANLRAKIEKNIRSFLLLYNRAVFDCVS